MTLSKRTVVARQRGERIHKLNRLWLSVDANVARAEKYKRGRKTWRQFMEQADRARKKIRTLDPLDRHQGPGQPGPQFSSAKADKRFKHYMACQGDFNLWFEEVLIQVCAHDKSIVAQTRGLKPFQDPASAKWPWKKFHAEGWTPAGAITGISKLSEVAK